MMRYAIFEPETLYYNALAAATEIAIASPESLADQPPKFIIDVCLVAESALKYFRSSAKSRYLTETSVQRLVRALRLPRHLFPYENVWGNIWIFTEESLDLTRDRIERLWAMIKRVAEDFPDCYYSDTAIRCADRDDFYEHHFARRYKGDNLVVVIEDSDDELWLG